MNNAYNTYAQKAFDLEGRNYENDPNDECTHFGLVLGDVQVYYNKPSATCADVKAITESEALKILKKLYWDKLKADDINSGTLACFIVDSAFNMGVGTIAKAVQAIIGVEQDGIVGSKTISAINACNAFEIYCKLYGWRLCRYQNIVASNPSKQEYFNGWVNRLNEFKVTQ